MRQLTKNSKVMLVFKAKHKFVFYCVKNSKSSSY